MKINQIAAILLCSTVMLIGFNAAAQQEPGILKQLLQTAETNYPLLKSKMLDVHAAQKNVSVSYKSNK